MASTALQRYDDWIDPSEIDRRVTRRFAHVLLGMVFVIVISFLVWADQAVLDEVTRGEGRVVPSGQTQVIQNLEGGILAEVLTNEGQIVEKGQVLMRIDNTVAESRLRELKQRYFSGLSTVARLEAEIAGATDPEGIKFPDDLLQGAPDVARSEMALFTIRQQQLQSQLAILQDQLAQRQQELAELRGKADNLRNSFGLAQKELDITRPLAAQGVVSQVDLLRLERQVNDLKSDINAADLARPRAEAAVEEARKRLNERIVTFKTDASQDLTKAKLELAATTEEMNANQDRVTRTEVRSPVHGTIKEIKIRTIGGVIQPGQNLVEITPIEDTLLVEAQIRPSDIAFIRPKQAAVIKVTAYDFSTYGGLDAVVEDISADTIQNEKGEHFFRIRLRTDKNFLGTAEKPLPIIPGMTASVDILTGHKTVLEYLLAPVMRARDTALRER
ncbi:MAG TPA: HlyD family type I secretion periplasmic adaptor subunit [Hypericibacter adhaerens]|jgi:adhesin transport system membrane fusion protein|uniref:Membrane fusion protein (MFP) family protein n=1 Tax=Hypericibacter adhaerens TaxID=2602016 RepID=A0A5J6MWR3_9PROT|nr:HlyD family type I secretion periplasmic adaptor subunit [Hypericibacter adhaerens]QEX22088.1 HlyD family type I secretion membrane fusion protein [Hypericibacter adhaerens]HWA46255.1 HlyD family type I secretion periplasmic adaptor subunit [Hypericibacter adhaerens]